MLSPDDIENRFGHHKATLEGPNPSAEVHGDIRELFKLLATGLNEILPDGREKSVMFTELETASMWAHKSLATQSPLAKDGE